MTHGSMEMRTSKLRPEGKERASPTKNRVLRRGNGHHKVPEAGKSWECELQRGRWQGWGRKSEGRAGG